LSEIEIGIEEIYDGSASVRICFKLEAIVKGRLFEVDVNVEVVLNRPDNDIQALEMDVPALYLGPIHHYTILLGVNSEM
jgi:hypothetical protein